MLESRRIIFVLALGISTLLPAGLAYSQEAQPEKARALLDQVKKSEQDRQIAVKQKEIERLQEDQIKTERDSSGLQQTIDSTTALISDSTEHLNKLTADSRRLEHELAVSEARINAERLKIEGLRALGSAQSKSLSALTRHAEEAEVRARVRTAELELLQVGKPVPPDGHEERPQDDLTKSRKTLALAETKTLAEEHAAREAMKAAGVKMALAESRAANAQRLADNDLTAMPIAEKTEKAKPKASERAAERVAEKKEEKKEKEKEKEKEGESLRRAQTVKPPAPIAAPPKPATTSGGAKPTTSANTVKPANAPFPPFGR